VFGEGQCPERITLVLEEKARGIFQIPPDSYEITDSE